MSNLNTKKKPLYILANFGGPRDLDEISPFLVSLLTDPDVIRPKLPSFIHRPLFRSIAKKRALTLRKDYEMIGGKSPIYEDTEWLTQALREKLEAPCIAFHRYLPSTHSLFFKQVEASCAEEIHVFPLFPQFSYATTGSIARFFANHLPEKIVQRFSWVPSYFDDENYISCFSQVIKEFLEKENLEEEKVLLFFSPHGLPYRSILEGDPYQKQCQISYEKIGAHFPKANKLIAYQSKFGRGQWLTPYTIDVCENISAYAKKGEHVVFIPLSFTSDHIETLFEVEKTYLPVVQEKGFPAFRSPALNRHMSWVDTVITILQKENRTPNSQLIQKR